MLIATANVLILPIEIAFQLDFFEHLAVRSINYVVDFLFFIDIFVNFRTSVNFMEDECFDPKTIATEYLKGRFFVDLISTIPFEVVVGDFVNKEWRSQLKLTSALKLIRILRL